MQLVSFVEGAPSIYYGTATSGLFRPIPCMQFKKGANGEVYGFFGVFDGHGGATAANFVKENLFINLQKHEKFPNDMEAALSTCLHVCLSAATDHLVCAVHKDTFCLLYDAERVLLPAYKLFPCIHQMAARLSACGSYPVPYHRASFSIHHASMIRTTPWSLICYARTATCG